MENSTTMAPTSVTAFNETQATDLSYEYVCSSADNLDCPLNCVSLEACQDCECAVAYVEDTGGPWGQFMDFFFCLLPILYLVYATVKPNPTPTTRSLPFSAVIMFLVRLMYLGSDPILTAGCVLLGFHEAITPLSIMAGAIMLFETMEATKCLPYMMREMKALTAGHPVAECMLLFAFAYLVEGASGFGTPVALGAPMLVSTGHPALEAVVIMLLFNTFATVWGAVGTPLWFGLGGLGLSEDDFVEISVRAAICMVFSSFLLIPMILTVLIPFAVIKKNIIFLLLSIATVMGPVAGLASMTYEFPSLMGGLIGFGLTAVLIKFRVGLAAYDPAVDGHSSNSGSGMAEQSTTNNNNDESSPVDYISEKSSRRRNISDLTEINVSTVLKQSTVKFQEDSPGATAIIPEEVLEADAPSKENDAKDDDVVVIDNKSSINGHWNVEVEADPEATNDAGTTIVLTAPSTPSVEGKELKKEGGVETTGYNKNEAESVLEPPLLEESGSIKQEQAEQDIKMSLMSAAERSRLADDELLGPRKTWAEGYLQETILRLFPIWAVVLTLILTRVASIGIKQYLTKEEPYFNIKFGTYGEFRMSVSLVMMLKNIMTYPGLQWKYELVYVPFLVPFVLISVFTMILYRKDMTCRPQDIVITVAGRLSNAAIALAGALTLVQLMIRFGAESPAFLLGTILADWLKQGFVVICPLLGALGSFFSGSTTVSNLTFGEIQVIAAEEIGVSVNAMLALQVYGASAGNGICLNNIIAALTVVGLDVSEGEILKRTGKYVLASTTIATVVMLAFFFRF